MIRRRWPDTILLTIVALGLFAWGAGLLKSTLFGSGLAVVAGFLFLAMAALGPASGPCPICGEILHGLFAVPISEYERCPHCRKYFLRSVNEEVPAEHVAAIPRFAVPIDDGGALPDLCCVCGAAATRTREVAYRSAGRISHTSPQTVKTELKAQAPYCAEHDGGVVIVSEDFAPSAPLIKSLAGSPPSEHRWVLKVRSYAFYREAVL